MTDLRAEDMALAAGGSLRLTVAEPEGPVRGGVVVLHEARGMTETVRSMVGELSGEGWLVAAPHLYHASGADNERGEIASEQVDEQLRALSGEAVLAAADGAFVWLANQGVSSDRIGVLGFELGGTAAMVIAGQRSLGAAVSVAAPGITSRVSDALPPLLQVAGELTCPWLGLFGDQDADTPGEQVERLQDAAASGEVATNVVRYSAAGHRFDTDPESSEDAWTRVLNWFDAHLR